MFSVLISSQHFAAYNYAALLFLFLVVLIHHACSARSLAATSCAPSSCGHIRNISYPFRLITDPENCGNKKYELACENNRAVVHLDNTTAAKYYVQEINYNFFSIRLVDASVDKDNCSSISHHSLTYYNLFGPELQYRPHHSSWLRLLFFVTCADPVSSPFYVNTSSCKENGTYTTNSSMSSPSHMNAYSYVVVDDYNHPLRFGDLMDSCHIDVIVPIMSWLLENLNKISYKQVHDSMLYGFVLTWVDVCCEFAQENRCNLNTTEFSTYCDDGASDGFIRVLLDFMHSRIDRSARLGLYILNFVASHITTEWERHVARKRISYSTFLLVGLVVFFVLFRVALFLFGIPCIITLLIYKWRRRHLSMYDMIEEFLQSHDNHLMPVRYSYSEIKKITNGFKDKLGEGGYGSVYKGKLRSGRFAAIKMLTKFKANGQDFMNEVGTIRRIHHVNVVQLIGFCAEGPKRALVYEFMPNGSLDKYIFSREDSNVFPLSNEKMHKISLGVARGIEYLHQGCDMQILHFDIKPHNILLDENFNPKVSDFGLAKLYPTENSIMSLTAARGTLGYMAPELFYKNIGGISNKADVYSFGMLLMKMVERRRNSNAHDPEHSSQIYFTSWAYDQVNEGKDMELGDVTEQECQTTKKMVIVAFWCIQMKPKDRPSMQSVIEMLEAEVEWLQMPPKPFFTPSNNQVNIDNPTILSNPPSDCIDSSYQYGR